MKQSRLDYERALAERLKVPRAVEASRRSRYHYAQLRDEARLNPPQAATGRFPYFTQGEARPCHN